MIDLLDDPRIGRVKALKGPIGYDHTPHCLYKFVYNVKSAVLWSKEDHQVVLFEGDTSVYNAYNHLTRYYYNMEHRIDCIEKYQGEGPNYSLYSFEKLFWEGPNQTNRIFHTKEGWAQYCQQYDYDPFGNVRRETFWGNLSGYNEKPIVYPPNGYPEYNGCEFTFKLYTYSDDGLNLMTSLTEGKRAHTAYAYHPGTDLLASKLTGPIGSIAMREFFDYDQNGTLVAHIQDDGTSPYANDLTGATLRHVRRITPTTQTPIGFPAITEDKYVDLETGSEHLLSKTIQTFSFEGWPTRQEVYDSNGQFAYAEIWEYNSLGKVIYHEDAAGRVTIKDYDANGNLITEKGPRPDVVKEYTYDFSDRLIRKDVIWADNRLCERYFYDFLGNKVATEDLYGNRTTYRYDEFGRITETIYPEIANEAGQAYTPSSKTIYTELGYPHTTIDPRGLVTSKRFTVKGFPYRVMYPDGSEESFVYDLEGTLSKHIHKNGSYTLYQYDYQKREVSKEMYSASGELLDGSYKIYSSFKLLQERTLGGDLTTYVYDFAGRLIETITNGAKTTCTYDSLGRQIAIHTHFGSETSEYFTKAFEYDCLNRVIEEREEDSSSRLLKKTEYSYDEDGNKNRIITHTKEKTAVITTLYDPFGQILEQIDAEGHIERTHYSYCTQNSLGKVVAHSETTDAMGVCTATTKDTWGRPCLTVKRTLANELQKGEFFYDENNNLIRQIDTVFSPNLPSRESVKAWKYDECNRQVSLTEAVGTPEQKQIQMVYNLFGQKERLIKPDGSQLFHTYDPLGRLKTLSSSDHTIHQRYEYDLKGNSVQVDDLIQQTSSLRAYDSRNNLLSETLGNGLTTRYSYDLIGRPLAAILPDESSVEYLYEASRLKEVRRLNRSQEATHTHCYEEYDFGGLLRTERYAGEAGTADYTYDVKGRLLTYASTHLKENVKEYDKAGNIRTRSIEDSIDTTHFEYAYDFLHQLKTESGTIEAAYTHDSHYNRLSKNDRACCVNSLNQLIDDGEYTYTYDLNGNVLKKSSASQQIAFTYDALDRLSEILQRTKKTTYTYDELNRRLTKTFHCWSHDSNEWEAKSSVRFLYHAQNEVGMVDQDNKLVQYRMLGAGKGAEIGASVLIELHEKAYAPLHDHNGNIVCLVDCADGTVAENYHFSAFGEEFPYDGEGKEIETCLNPWRFSSKRVDEESGFVYFGRRYYSPSIGRWITADPIGLQAGPNLYAYVLNNPLTHFDLYGLLAETGGMQSSLSRPMSSLLYAGYKVAQAGCRAAGYTIETLGFHLIPIPGVQDAVRAIGTVLQGKCFCKFETWKQTRSCYGDLERPEKDPLNAACLVNGMLTSKDSFMEQVHAASTEIGGYNIHYCYNSSHGLLADLFESGLQCLGVPTHSAEMLAKKCSKLSSEMGNGGIISIYAHSQGGLLTDNLRNYLSYNERQSIRVNTFGSPRQLSENDFGKAHNYISSRDLIPWLDPIKTAKAFCGKSKETTVLASDYKGIDHAWANTAYQQAMMKSLHKQYSP